MILNEQLTESEFEERKKQILSSPELQQECEKRFEELRSQERAQNIIKQSENCTGNCIVESHNCHSVYDVHHMQDVRYVYDSGNITDSMDLFSVYGPGSLNYEVYSASIAVHNNLFIRDCWPAENLIYCDHCFGAKNSFGCIGLGRNEYCILNKQYTKEEYESMVPRIIESMDAKREWGEFFPAESSPFPLKDTAAHSELTESTKPFKLIPQEIEFYEKMNLSEPTIHPHRRHEERLNRKQRFLNSQ